MSFRLESVWPSPPAEVREEVVRFWLSERALPNRPAAEERADQLLVLARDESSRVAGVNTAVRAFVPQLSFDCFYYRTFIGHAARTRGLRSTGLVWKILHESYRTLNQRFLKGLDPGVLGLYAEMENPSTRRRRNETVWQDDGMNFVFIGRTPDGKHQRVWYFEAARVP